MSLINNEQPKSPLRIIGEGTAFNSFSNVALKFVGLATVFFILRRLSAYEYGLTELTISSLPLLSIFFLPGMGDVVIADMSLERGKGNLSRMKSIFLQFFKLQFLLSIVVWAIVFFGANLIANYYEGPISLLLKIYSFSFLLSPFRSMIIMFFTVNLKFFQQSFYTFLEEVFKLIFLLFFFFILGKGPDG